MTETPQDRASDRLTLVTRHAHARALPFHLAIKDLEGFRVLPGTDLRVRIGTDRTYHPLAYRTKALLERARELLAEAESILAESTEASSETDRVLDRLRELVSDAPQCNDLDVQRAQALETAGLHLVALMVDPQLAHKMIELAADGIDAVIYDARHAAFDGIYAKIAIDRDIDYFEVVQGLYRDGRLDAADVLRWMNADLSGRWQSAGLQEMLDHLLSSCVQLGETPALPGFSDYVEQTSGERLEEAARLLSEGQLTPRMFRQVAVAAEVIDRDLPPECRSGRETGTLRAIVLRSVALARMSQAVLSALGRKGANVAPSAGPPDGPAL